MDKIQKSFKSIDCPCQKKKGHPPNIHRLLIFGSRKSAPRVAHVCTPFFYRSRGVSHQKKQDEKKSQPRGKCTLAGAVGSHHHGCAEGGGVERVHGVRVVVVLVEPPAVGETRGDVPPAARLRHGVRRAATPLPGTGRGNERQADLPARAGLFLTT